MTDDVFVKPDRCVWCGERPVSDGLLWGCDACTFVCACCAEPRPFENGNDVDGVCDDCATEYCDACEGTREGV